MPKFLYFFSLIIPISTLISLFSHGWMTYFAPIIAFIVLPLLELVLPKATYNFKPEEEMNALKDKFYDFTIYSMLPIQFSLLFLFCFQIANDSYSAGELFGLIFSMGISCGVIGINVGHELGHRKNELEQILAKLLLSTSCYSHFFVEHNKGHHKHVSTEHDPASASLNQTVFSFWKQSMLGSFKSALKIEKKRLKESSKNPFKNEVLRWKFIELGLALFFATLFGLRAMLCFFAAAFIGGLLLECVNYIEHYGLRRRRLPSGKYEKVTPFHSWNSDHLLGRLVLFDVTRHSDHHANINRKYQVLRTFDDKCPQFPTGYPGMILISLIPPLWFKMMNKRVEKIQMLNT